MESSVISSDKQPTFQDTTRNLRVVCILEQWVDILYEGENFQFWAATKQL